MAEWAEKGDEIREIRDNMLGWDITDFGQGDFEKTGLCGKNRPWSLQAAAEAGL